MIPLPDVSGPPRRWRATPAQKSFLERFYHDFTDMPDRHTVDMLSASLAVERQHIRIWFQNRRQRQRKRAAFTNTAADRARDDAELAHAPAASDEASVAPSPAPLLERTHHQASQLAVIVQPTHTWSGSMMQHVPPAMTTAGTQPVALVSHQMIADGMPFRPAQATSWSPHHEPRGLLPDIGMALNVLGTQLRTPNDHHNLAACASPTGACAEPSHANVNLDQALVSPAQYWALETLGGSDVLADASPSGLSMPADIGMHTGVGLGLTNAQVILALSQLEWERERSSSAGTCCGAGATQVAWQGHRSGQCPAQHPS